MIDNETDGKRNALYSIQGAIVFTCYPMNRRYCTPSQQSSGCNHRATTDVNMFSNAIDDDGSYTLRHNFEQWKWGNAPMDRKLNLQTTKLTGPRRSFNERQLLLFVRILLEHFHRQVVADFQAFNFQILCRQFNHFRWNRSQFVAIRWPWRFLDKNVVNEAAGLNTGTGKAVQL